MKKLLKDQIFKIIRDNQKAILSFGVKEIGIFGSHLSGLQRADSDVDILVEFFAEKKTYQNFIELSFLLEELLGHPVDLLTKQSLDPFIGKHILSHVEYVDLNH